MENFFLTGLIPVILATVVTLLFLYVCYLSVTSIRRSFGKPQRNVLYLKHASNYRIALVSAAYVIGVKLIIMIIAHVLTQQTDFFADAAALWQRSDSPHYVSIASLGYQAVGEERLFIVFFPLYPALLGLFGRITGEYFWTGSVISMVCLTIAGYYLFKLARNEYGEKVAYRTLKYFMLFPSVFFAMFPYTEALFLMLLLAAMYYLRKKEYILSGILGAFCALTRSVGVLLVFPFVIQAAQDVWEGKFDRAFWKRLLKTGWPVFLIPIGTLIYLSINWIVQGSPFSFMKVQKAHWGQGFDILPHTIWYITRNIFTYQIDVSIPLWITQILFILAILAAMVMVAKRQAPVFLVYSLFFFYFSISLTWLLSAPRYMLVMFPCMMELARRCKSKKADRIMTCVLAVCLIVFASAFAIGYSIY